MSEKMFPQIAEVPSLTEQRKAAESAHQRLLAERDTAFPELAPLFTKMENASRELDTLLRSIEQAKTTDNLKEVASKAKEFTKELIPGVVAFRRAAQLLSPLLGSVAYQAQLYRPTDTQDIKNAIRTYMETRKLAGAEGQTKLREAQGELAQAELDLNKAANALTPEKQAELLNMQASIRLAEQKKAELQQNPKSWI